MDANFIHACTSFTCLHLLTSLSHREEFRAEGRRMCVTQKVRQTVTKYHVFVKKLQKLSTGFMYTDRNYSCGDLTVTKIMLLKIVLKFHSCFLGGLTLWGSCADCHQIYEMAHEKASLSLIKIFDMGYWDTITFLTWVSRKPDQHPSLLPFC